MATSEADNKEIARRDAEEVWGEGNLDLIDEYIADDYVGHQGIEEVHGPEEYKEFVTLFRSAFSDIEVTVEDLIAEGDKVVMRNRATGIHDGEFMGIAPTGNECEVTGIVIARIDDGKVVEAWDQVDMMGLMQQLGVVEPPGE